MPLRDYGVLTGRATAGRAETGGDTPHHQILVEADGDPYRVAVNVRADTANAHAADLLYLVDADFRHPLTDRLLGLRGGWTALPSRPGGLALDYVRGELFDPRRLRRLPANQPGPDNDLNEALADQVRRAIGDPSARFYAFGSRWGPEPGQPDDVFGFEPGNGVHDVHMNQGNDPAHAGDDGPWQDGALLLQLPAERRWVAIFLAFQTQTRRTDDRTGAALPGADRDGPRRPAAGEPTERHRRRRRT